MIQTVIFDMDGVIIDSEPVYFEIDKQMFEELNIAVSFEEHCSYVGTSSQNMWNAIITKHGVAEQPAELMRKEYSLYLEHLANAKDLVVDITDIQVTPHDGGVVASFVRRDHFTDAESGRAVRLEVRLTKVLVQEQSTWKIGSGQ